MLELTHEQKLEWVERDYKIGRLYAMGLILGNPQLKEDKQLHKMCTSLLVYDNFGDGDDYENNLWFSIIDHLDLEEYYENFWE